MTATLIINGRLFDPGNGIDQRADLLVEGGRVTWIGQSGARQPDLDVVDASGMTVCPGFIDLHCHLREPGFEQKETIASGTRAAASGGFTTVCCMPNTMPAIDRVEVVQLVQNRARQSATVRVIPVSCVTEERLGKRLVNMHSLAYSQILGFSDDGDPVRNEDLMRNALIETSKVGLPVIDHCEDPVGGAPEGEVKMVERDLRLAEETGGWIHIAHVSAAGSAVAIREAKAKGIHVTAEVTPHHLTLTDKEIAFSGTNAKVNPPLRSESDRRAMTAALKSGVIDVIATDHAPHALADKQKDFASAASGITGFDTAIGSLMGLVASGEMTLAEVIRALTTNPARILRGRFGHLGSLAVGSMADIVLIDEATQWTVNTAEFVSKGRNTPLAGRQFKGRVVATLVGGRLVDSRSLFRTGGKPRNEPLTRGTASHDFGD